MSFDVVSSKNKDHYYADDDTYTLANATDNIDKMHVDNLNEKIDKQ